MLEFADANASPVYHRSLQELLIPAEGRPLLEVCLKNHPIPTPPPPGSFKIPRFQASPEAFQIISTKHRHNVLIKDETVHSDLFREHPALSQAIKERLYVREQVLLERGI